MAFCPAWPQNINEASAQVKASRGGEPEVASGPAEQF